jgi:hypothetical protein
MLLEEDDDDDDDVSRLGWRASCLAARLIHPSPRDVPAPLLLEKREFLSLDGQQPVVLACRVNHMVIPACISNSHCSFAIHHSYSDLRGQQTLEHHSLRSCTRGYGSVSCWKTTIDVWGTPAEEVILRIKNVLIDVIYLP